MNSESQKDVLIVLYAVHGISVNAVVERNKTIDTKGTPRPRASSSCLLEETLRIQAKSKSGDNNNEGWLTGGPDGIQVPRPFVFGWRLRGLEVWYWITGGVTVVGAWLAANVLASSTGRAMRALQDSETAAQIAGVNVARVKLAAFVLSAVYASVAGSCFSFSAGLITPDKAGFLYSVELVTMVVIGGMGSIMGSVVGAAVLVALPQLLASFQNYEQIMLGLVMMAMMIFLRSGIVPSLTSWVSQWRR